jgi:hypothetical protein
LRCYSCDNKNKYNLGLKIPWEGKFQNIVTKELLIELYVNQKKNILEISKIYNCGKSTIANYLKKYGIPLIPWIRKSWIESMTGENSPKFGKLPSHGKKIKYKGIWMRSSWEVAYAKWLDEKEVKWQYESETFNLGKCTYTPDFYLPETDTYIEIKGWWRDNAKKKFNLFKKLYLFKKITVLQKQDLKQMEVL